MDSEENSSASFIPVHLQKSLNVIEGGETQHKWKLVRNTASFTLIINFPAKTDKGQGQGNQPPLKKRASGVSVSQHKDKERTSSDVRIAESGSFRPWVVSPGRFALSRLALVLWVGRFALIMWVVSPVSCFARELFRP